MSKFRQPENHQAHNISGLQAVWAILNKFFKGGRLNVSSDTVIGKVSKSGTGTIASATTTVAVTHGAGFTPTIDQIFVTPSNNPTNDPGNMWVSAIGATTFSVNCRADPGASGLSFGWRLVSI